MSGKLKTFRLALVVLFTLIVGGLSAQTVKGTVKDASGEAVIGATVQEAGTKNATVTDIDGNYTIKLTGNNKLQFSYIGMKQQTIDPAGRTVVNVTMEDESTTLDDLVVIGYGVVKKRDLTGAVTSVSAEDIGQVPVSNVSEALTGRMAGVNITTTEGSPDADVKIRVRGGGSLSQDNSPLYVVDGFPVESISDISPSEIESIDVLKDASSTAIYGARGANGVIIVTTKSGHEGKTQVNFNGSIGWKKVTKLVKTMDPYNYAYYQYELDANGAYGNYDDLDIWKSVDGVDYQDEIFGRTGLQKQYNVNVNGGSKELKYNIGFAHNDEESIMKGSGYSKNNVNAKLNAKLNKWLTLDFQGRLAFTKLNGLNGGADTNESNAANSIVANTVKWNPVEPLVSIDDSDDSNDSNTRRNPLERLTDTYKYQERFSQNYNVALNWKPVKGLTFRTEFGYGWKYNKVDQVWATRAVTNSKYGYNGQPQALFERVENKNWRNSNTVTYDNNKLFGGRDHLNVLVGQEWSSSQDITRTNISVAFPTSMTVDEVLANTAAGTALPNTGNIEAQDNIFSFFGRINYTMADKYLATFTLRADGSSKFGKNNRWGYFPSLALAWRISEEGFMKGTQDWLSNLKLRLSFGMAGNNRINSGLIYPVYSMPELKDAKFPEWNNGNSGMTTPSLLQHGKYLYNPDLKWETTITRNIGIDYGFWNNRISGTLDFYWNTTKDLLMQVDIPSNTGYEYQYQNYGKTSNKGVEFALNAVLVDKKNFGLNFNFNIAYNRGKIEELNASSPWQSSNWSGKTLEQYEDFRVEVGGRLGELWGYKTNGYYTAYNPATGEGDLVLSANGTWSLREGLKDNSYTMFGGLYPGVIKLQVDENGDPIKQRLGNTVPTTTGGFGIDGRLGNFDFNVFFNYSLGNKLVNGTKLANAFYAGSSRNYNLVADFNVNNRYTWIDPETGLNLGRPSDATITSYGGVDQVMQRLNEINQGKAMYNPAGVSKMYLIDYAVEDASFLRVQNITVGYTLPKKWTRAINIENIRIYFTGYNLFCITGYDGYDPEVDTSSKKNPMCPGIDYAAYPKSRTFVGGINVTF